MGSIIINHGIFRSRNLNQPVWGSLKKSHSFSNETRWWFQICFIFTPICGRFPIWRIFFRWVGSTTNQEMVSAETPSAWCPLSLNPFLSGGHWLPPPAHQPGYPKRGHWFGGFSKWGHGQKTPNITFHEILVGKKGILIMVWMVVSNIFYVHPYLGKWSIFTNIFNWVESTS